MPRKCAGKNDQLKRYHNVYDGISVDIQRSAQRCYYSCVGQCRKGFKEQKCKCDNERSPKAELHYLVLLLISVSHSTELIGGGKLHTVKGEGIVHVNGIHDLGVVLFRDLVSLLDAVLVCDLVFVSQGNHKVKLVLAKLGELVFNHHASLKILCVIDSVERGFIGNYGSLVVRIEGERIFRLIVRIIFLLGSRNNGSVKCIELGCGRLRLKQSGLVLLKCYQELFLGQIEHICSYICFNSRFVCDNRFLRFKRSHVGWCDFFEIGEIFLHKSLKFRKLVKILLRKINLISRFLNCGHRLARLRVYTVCLKNSSRNKLAFLRRIRLLKNGSKARQKRVCAQRLLGNIVYIRCTELEFGVPVVKARVFLSELKFVICKIGLNVINIVKLCVKLKLLVHGRRYYRLDFNVLRLEFKLIVSRVLCQLLKFKLILALLGKKTLEH